MLIQKVLGYEKNNRGNLGDKSYKLKRTTEKMISRGRKEKQGKERVITVLKSDNSKHNEEVVILIAKRCHLRSTERNGSRKDEFRTLMVPMEAIPVEMF